MNLFLNSDENGPALMVEVVPDGINVGCGASGRGQPVYGSVAVSYTSTDMPLMMAVCTYMEKQGGRPVVALFEDNVQILYKLSPIPKDVLSAIAPPAFADIGLRSLYVTSIADAFPESDGQQMFNRCWEKDKSFVFFVYPASQLLRYQTIGRPLYRTSGKEVKRELMSLM